MMTRVPKSHATLILMVLSIDSENGLAKCKTRRNKSVNRSWLAFGLSASMPSFTILGVATEVPLVRQPGYLKRYAREVDLFVSIKIAT
jgi:hypothetical protein